MPFGLCNAPAIFQELMNTVLEGMNGKFVLAYLDDLVIFSESLADHIKHLHLVFGRLRQHNLKLKLSTIDRVSWIYIWLTGLKRYVV